MKSWFLMAHNLKGKYLEASSSKLSNMGVEIYLPVQIEYNKRSDCNSFRVLEKELFPGYIFMKFDPAVIHTTTISDMQGMKGFVRFSNKLAQPSEALIQALKSSLLMRLDHPRCTLEFADLPEDIADSLWEIAAISSKLKREIALLTLLQKLSSTPMKLVG